MSPTSIALRPAAAAKKLGISVSTLYSRVRTESDFPRPIKAGPRTTVFLERDLDAWLAARAAASNV
jgi:prophage regulatory protein